MQKICFVCTGNTCRSPVCEKILNKLFKSAHIEDFKAYSLGLCTNKNEDMSFNSKLVLNEYKIKVKSRKSKQLTKGCFSKYDLFITMTKEQKLQFPPNTNVFSFGEMVGGEDILDPYGEDISIYKKMAEQIYDYCDKLTKKYQYLKEQNNDYFSK